MQNVIELLMNIDESNYPSREEYLSWRGIITSCKSEKCARTWRGLIDRPSDKYGNKYI